MQLVRGMSLKDCREDDQGVTEIGNEGTSNNQTTILSNPERLLILSEGQKEDRS